ncbi:MAG TPA: hypothetical protein VNK43_02780 [Gemmatimonadales bacterium]|nr:hypothetical protein [Gemmatimonadales bacterium]
MPDYKDYLMALVHCYPGRLFTVEELSRETAIPVPLARQTAEDLIASGQLARNGERYLLNRRRPGTRIPPLYERRVAS